MIDVDKLPKHRRDWLEIWGNQWGTRTHNAEPMTAEEKQALADALNPFVVVEESTESYEASAALLDMLNAKVARNL